MILDKKIIYLLLFLFHILLGWTFNSIAYSDFLPSLHNGEGFWFFAADSMKYHSEAIIQLEYLKNSDWVIWFNSFKNHVNVKVISLSYWILENPSPISLSIVNALIWLVSIVLIFRSSQLIFPKNFFLPFLISTFFFHPSILIQSTQLLRDPYLILGICCFIYGWVILENNCSRWRWLFYMLLGFILTVSMRSYLFPVFAIPTLIYMTWVVYHKRWMFFPFAILVVLLAIFQSTYINNRIIISQMADIQANALEVQVFEKKVSNLKNIIINMKSEESSDEEFKDFQLKILDNLTVEKLKRNKKFINSLEKEYEFLIKNIEIGSPVLNNNFKAKIIGKFNNHTTLINNNSKAEVINEDDESIAQSLEKHAKNFPPTIYTYNPVVDFSNIIAHHIGAIRYDWIRVVVEAGGVGSVIDVNVPIHDLHTALKYLPRAIQIGFFAPFPKDFFVTGNAVGRIGYIVSCVEMLLFYFIFFGFFYSFFVNVSIFRQLIPVFIFSFTIIILLAYVIPVLGALFRMRQGYMIPFYIYGMYGLQLIYNRFSLRFFHTKY